MDNMIPEATDVLATIRHRTSVRTYAPDPLRGEDRQRLEDIFRQATTGPFGGRVGFELLEKKELNLNEMKKLGTYGFIKGAHTFVVGSVQNGPRDVEDFGFVFENMILDATASGLSTCWLGAAFHRSAIADMVNLASDESIPAITPIGYAADKRRLRERVIRWSVRAQSRVAFEKRFFDGGFDVPLQPEAAGDFHAPLEAVRLAPSAGNKQPWRIVVDERRTKAHLFLKRHPLYENVVKGADLQRIDMGIAMCHFSLAAQHQGRAGAWSDTPPEDLSPPPELSYSATWRARSQTSGPLTATPK